MIVNLMVLDCFYVLSLYIRQFTSNKLNLKFLSIYLLKHFSLLLKGMCRNIIETLLQRKNTYVLKEIHIP